MVLTCRPTYVLVRAVPVGYSEDPLFRISVIRVSVSRVRVRVTIAYVQNSE